MIATRNRLRAGLSLLVLALAVTLGGCGRSDSNTGATKVDPLIGQRHHEMEDYMKNNPAKANSSKSSRNHP